MLIAPDPGPGGFRGEMMGVETDERLQQDVRLLSLHEDRKARLSPLPTPGDYQVVGEIKEIETDEETMRPYQAYVAVDYGFFTVDVREVQEKVQIGDWLSFTAVGLIFSCDGG